MYTYISRNETTEDSLGKKKLVRPPFKQNNPGAVVHVYNPIYKEDPI
jgi:hypothetical protein